jgi:protease I
MAKILIPIGDAAEAMDTLYPYFRAREAGYEVTIAAPERRIYELVMHEVPPGWDITRESASYHLASDIAFSEIEPDGYSGLFLTGGRAPEYIRYDQNLIRAVRHFFDAGKPVCVTCHGAEIVAAADVIRNRRIATVAKCQLDIEARGGIFVNEGCVRDGNMVSGRTWHDQHLYMAEFMQMVAQQCVKSNGTPVAHRTPVPGW